MNTEERKGNIQPSKIIIPSIIIIVIMIIVSFDLIERVNKRVSIHTFDTNGTIEEIQTNEVKEYPFVIQRCRVDYMEIFLENAMTFNINVVVKKANGEVYYTCNKTENDLIADARTGRAAIKLEPPAGFDIGQYSVNISNMGENISIWIKLQGETKYLNIEAVKGSNLGVYIAVFVIGVCVVLYALIAWLYSKYDLEIHKVFILIAVPLSLIYLILFPPWTIPDATAHYMATYRISNRLLGYDKTEEWLGRAEDRDTFNKIWNMTSGEANPNMQSYVDEVYNFAVCASDTRRADMPIHADHMKYYSVINYWPQVLGLTIGRVLGLSSILCIYLARLFITAFYIWACYHAIKITPVGKSIFFLIPLLPTSLMVSGSFSYDAMVLITTLNFVANIFALSKDYNSKWRLIETIVWIFLVGAVKGGGYLLMLPMVLVLLGIPEKKKKLQAILSVSLSGLFSVVLFDKILQIGQTFFQLGYEGTEKMTASFAYKHPFGYFKMLTATYLNDLNELSLSMVGTRLGWLELVVPSLLVLMMAAAICIYALVEKDDISLNKRGRCLCILTVCLTLVFTPMMLLSWTNKGSTTIAGLQGRYYLPILILLLLPATKGSVFYGCLVDEQKQLAVKKKSILLFVALSMIVIYYLLRTYLVR